MKKWMIGSLILIAMMVVAAGVYAQTSDKEKKQAKKECTFVDKDKDGKCDTCGSTADACKKACTTDCHQQAKTAQSALQLQHAARQRVRWFRPGRYRCCRSMLPWQEVISADNIKKALCQ